jgi:hypothetical protein
MALAVFRPSVRLCAAALLVAAASGCELFVAADRDRIAAPPAAEDAAGGAGGESTSMGGGGVGTRLTAEVECLRASDCPEPENECSLRACDPSTHTCNPVLVGEFSAVSGQVANDCKKIVCDGRGGTKEIDDPSDVPDDGNDCTDDVCFPVGPTNAMSAPKTACDESGGTICDGAGACVECVDDGDCATGTCEPLSKTCVPDSCENGMLDADEADVDCGDACGPTCAPGQACDDASDCAPPATMCDNSVCT